VVVRGEPFQFTTEPETKLVPVTARVKAAPPAVALEGASLVTPGTALSMVKVFAPEVPPPGVGMNTVTEAVPAVLMSAAVIVAVICVLLTKCVVCFFPFHITSEVETKLEPLAVSVKVAPPAVAEVGEIESRAGTGLSMVKDLEAETPPPGAGLVTVTLMVPGVAMSVLVI